ncbi:L-threonine dehydratase catabolic TdcB isoform X3 [Heterodontus francisci]|uniref:L-threonine dehydratase catabolic TdcB isoform X3 n=1 Tax=Heterodontus francisci TaxID=7792 RepID=UPI00355C75DB
MKVKAELCKTTPQLQCFHTFERPLLIFDRKPEIDTGRFLMLHRNILTEDTFREWMWNCNKNFTDLKSCSFKIRGVANQFSRRESGPFITMSAGNYGKAFAYASKHFGHQGKVLMADTAPASRTALLASYGVEVEQMPSKSLLPTVEQFVKDQKMIFLHPFDDIDLIAGYGSIGLEILEEIPNPDVVIVCCGGGGLLAGVAAAIKLSGCTTTNIYGVEPKEGSNAFQICRQHVKEILLVSDDEIKEAVSMLYNIGLVVEPSGAAAFAAIVGEKINLKGKTVVVIITGGNVTPEELCDIIH